MKLNEEGNYTLIEALAYSPEMPESLSEVRMVKML